MPTNLYGENDNFQGSEELLLSHNVEVVNLRNQEITEILHDFIAQHSDIWNEDISTT